MPSVSGEQCKGRIRGSVAEPVGTLECSSILDLKTSVSFTGLIAVNSILDLKDSAVFFIDRCVNSILDLKGPVDSANGKPVNSGARLRLGNNAGSLIISRPQESAFAI